MDRHERKQRKRRPLTLHEKWEIDGELNRKINPEYYDREEFEKDFKTNLDRVMKIIEKSKKRK